MDDMLALRQLQCGHAGALEMDLGKTPECHVRVSVWGGCVRHVRLRALAYYASAHRERRVELTAVATHYRSIFWRASALPGGRSERSSCGRSGAP